MKKILFPTDFSPAANQAFTFALHLADELQAEIIFLHAYNLMVTGEMLAPADFLQSVRDEEELRSVKEFQAAQQRALQEAHNPIKITPLIRMGFASDVILEACDREKPDFIVMGTKGAGNALETVVGSITTQVMSDCKLPVLAIPENAAFRGLKRIAYATDFREKDAHISAWIGKLVKGLDAGLVGVHIHPESEAPLSEEEIASLTAMYRSDSGISDMSMYVLIDNEIEERLEAFVETQDIHILALARRQRNFWSRMFDPGLSRRLALHSDKPLLSLPL
ncbi:MAG: universal stress protein [Bacteroidetes bacterium]|nr:MAG: universal stress protein [Bacteroidota bacterium]